MAQENGGVARRIYEGTDAVLQLEGFYEEVAVPLLTNVKMAYKGATHLTQSAFIHYYNGSEIVVAGQISNITDFSTAVIAVSTNTEVMTYTDIKPSQDENPSPVMSGFENFLQRLWAYLTLKQLLDREVMLSSEEKKAVKQEALDLALRYGFVTPLTSMVVTKPQAEGSHVAHKPKEGESRTYSNLAYDSYYDSDLLSLSDLAYYRLSKDYPMMAKSLSGRHHIWTVGAAVLLVVGMILAGLWFWRRKHARPPPGRTNQEENECVNTDPFISSEDQGTKGKESLPALTVSPAAS